MMTTNWTVVGTEGFASAFRPRVGLTAALPTDNLS